MSRRNRNVVPWQSRNVVFCRGFSRVHVNLRVPVKRRRALVATNPIKEYPAGTQRDDEEYVFLPAHSRAWIRGCQREAAAPAQAWFPKPHIGPVDSVMPKKTHPEVPGPTLNC